MVGLSDASEAGPPGDRGRRPDVFDGYASTRIIVKFAPGVIEAPDVPGFGGPVVKRGDARLASKSAVPARLSAALQATWSQWDVIGIRRAYTHEFGNPEIAARHGLDRTCVLEVPAGTDTPAMAAALAAFSDQIEFAEVDAIGGVAQVIPNDEYFSRQYGMHNTGQTGGVEDADIDAPEAWELHTGEYGTVTVAIVDSGVDPHPEYNDRLLAGINTDNPLTPDLTIDGCPHGTHVAGIVAAAGNNGIGVAGVTWGANILPVRVLDGCVGYETAAADGVIWAVDHEADIINISLQYPTNTPTLEDAVNYAYDHGVLVVSAAGNDDYCGAGVVCSPARFVNSMAVSATNDDDVLAGFSNWGDELDVCAPGDRIWSTWINNWYTFRSGTSMATPHVSGLAALIKSYAPELTHDEIRDIITSSTGDLGPEGWDNKYGHGRINAHHALLATDGIPWIISSSPPDGAIDARQPFEPDGWDEAGWQWVDLTFDGDISELTKADFRVTQEGEVGGALSVVGLVPLQEDVARVVLNRKISVRAWTTITHLGSGGSVRLGYLPGDVNGDGTSAHADILALIDAINGTIGPLPIWSTDIDRSERTAPADILREIDLLNGADSYDPFIGATLP